VVGEERYVYTLVNEVKEVIIRVCLPKLVIPQADLKIIIFVIALLSEVGRLSARLLPVQPVRLILAHDG